MTDRINIKEIYMEILPPNTEACTDSTEYALYIGGMSKDDVYQLKRQLMEEESSMPSYDNHKTVIFQINNIAVIRYYDYSHHCFKWTFENYGGPTSNLNYDELLDLISVLKNEDGFLMNYMIDREKNSGEQK